MIAEDATETTDNNSRLDEMLQAAHELPAIPKIAVQVAHLVDSPFANATQVAGALSSDQVLTARVLKMANSAFYGSPRRVSTVTDAIVLLGMQTIRTMAMAASCYDSLDREVKSYALRKGDLWKHAICVGYASQLIARRSRCRAPEEAFVAGLLHDIGKVVISLNMSEEFTKVVEMARITDVPFSQIERDILGFDHAEVGARITEIWKLPEQLVQAIRYHHCPSSQPVWSQLTAIVHVADVVCLTMGIGVGSDGLRYELEDGVLEKLRFDQEGIEEIIMMVADYLADTAKSV